MPKLAAHLPAPPKHEWLEAVKYWNSGGRGPVWFVADPLRSDLALIPLNAGRSCIDGRSVSRCWSGAPGRTSWTGTSIEAPDWYLGEGWALTPETAGVAA